MASGREEFYFLVLFVCFFVPTSRKLPSPPSSHWKTALGYQYLQSQVPILLWCIFPPASYPVDIRKERPHPAVCCPFSSLVSSPFIFFMFSGLLLRALYLPASWFNSSTFLHHPPFVSTSACFQRPRSKVISPMKLWQIPRLARMSVFTLWVSASILVKFFFFLTFISLSPFPLVLYSFA